MRWLLFLSRLAFIFGVFFLLYVLMLAKEWLGNPTIDSTFTTFYFIGIVIIPLANLCYLVVFIIKGKLKAFVPLWLIVINLLFLFALIFFIFYLNDPYYHQK